MYGKGTSHRVNGIAVQANQFGPHPQSASGPIIMKLKRRSIKSVDRTLPVYNVGKRCGPHSRGYVEVKLNQIMERAWKKNLPWILVRLHAREKQSVPSWTGFNILVRNDQKIGNKGFSLRPNAVSKFYLVAEYRSTFLGQLKDILHINRSSFQHKDLQPTRIARDESDVKSIISVL